MEVFLRATIYVVLDEEYGSAENVPRLALTKDVLPHSYNGTMPGCIARQSCVVNNVEKSLNRHENHRGDCRFHLRAMPISILNS